MKKFFKALAVVLALTLVIGTIPASAAVELSLKKTSKIIYIGGAKGTKADGTACKSKSAALLSKLVKNFDSKTMTIKVATEDAAIAKASKKSSKVSAVAIGTTKATISVFDSDDIKLFEQSIDINVKKNAESVAVNADAILSGKVGVNTPYTVVLPRKADGKFVDTDARALTANSDSVVITKKAPTTFEVTFTKAGDFELTAYAYQSKKFPAATATADVIKVSAALNPVATKQASLSSAYVEFDCNVEGIVSATNFRAYTKTIDGKPVFFSNVESVSAKDETAEVKFFSQFLPDHEYFVSYNGVEIGSFKAITVTKDSVVDVETADITIVCEQVTEANSAVKLLDASGIDIKDAVVDGATLFSKATFKFTDADGSQAFVDGNKLYIKEAGKTYTCEVTYKDFKKTFKVTSVAKDEWEFDRFDYEKSGVYKLGAGDVTAQGNTDKKVTLTMTSVGTYAEELQIVAIYKKGAEEERRSIARTGFKAVSGDETKVMVGEKIADGYAYLLSPNNEGVANIIIYAEINGVETAIGSIPVEVKPARKADSVDVELSNNKFNMGYEDDAITAKFVVKDQYGDLFGNQFFTKWEQKTGKDVVEVTDVTTAGAISFKLVKPDELPEDKDKSVDVTLEFTFVNNLKKAVAIKVGNETIAYDYKVAVSEKELDTALTAGTTSVKTAVVSTKGVSKNGYNLPGAEISYADEAPVSKLRTTTETGVKYVYTVSLNGATIKDIDNLNIDGDDNEIAAVVKNRENNKASKLAAGTYTVTLYAIDNTVDKNDSAKPITLVKVLDTATITVKDSQKQLEWTKDKEFVDRTAFGSDEAALLTAFTFKFNNGPATPITLSFNTNMDTKRAYVASAKYTINNTTFGDFDITANIGVLIDLAKLVDLK